MVGYWIVGVRKYTESENHHLGAETHAAIDDADWSLWLRIILVEISTHHFDIRRISQPARFP